MEMDEEQRLIYAIALRLATAKQLAALFHTGVPELRVFVADNEERIAKARERFENPEPESALSTVEPGQLSDLWITNKFQRLKRMQNAAEDMESLMSQPLSAGELSTAVREFRSYMMLAANELGQLLHRGAGDSGDGSYLSVDIQGVDMENLR